MVCSNDVANNITGTKLVGKFDGCLANHFVIRQIDKKISQEKEEKNDTGNDNAFPWVCFPDRSCVLIPEQEHKSEREECQPFYAGKDKQSDREKYAS
ncbi:MAG TPA: hypothetical protein VJH89_01195, partial [Patescibacteria group bacterium]|nr:hypothetical protein [Patescibacteria group bacterium]